MKTKRKWLETLPEPYRTESLANMIGENSKYNSLTDALSTAFVWQNSSQGQNYWDDLHDKINAGTLEGLQLPLNTKHILTPNNLKEVLLDLKQKAEYSDDYESTRDVLDCIRIVRQTFNIVL